MPRIFVRTPIEERFWRHVNKDGPVPPLHPELGNCWLWTGSLDPPGYGHLYSGNRTAAGNPKFIYAHRFAYGDIPDGMEVNHLCEVEACCRRSHLEAVPHFTNMHYSGPAKRRAAQTHCIRGHPFVAANTYIRPNGTRQCLACIKVRKSLNTP